MNAQRLSLDLQPPQGCFLLWPVIVYPKKATHIPQFIPHGAINSGVNFQSGIDE
jgi:hypothetical protein